MMRMIVREQQQKKVMNWMHSNNETVDYGILLLAVGYGAKPQ